MSSRRRWLLWQVAALTVSLVLLEGGLRLYYEDLPSLHGVDLALLPPDPAETASKPQARPRKMECNLSPLGRPRPLKWTRSIEGDGEPVGIWVGGDSIALGAGVEPEESYAFGIAQRVSAHTGRPVVIKNMSVNGGDYCEYLRELDSWLNVDHPDLLLIGAFADDLEHRVMWIAAGKPVGYPGLIQNPTLRAVASNSYLANLVWVQLSSRLSTGPRRTADPESREVFVETFRAVGDRVQNEGARLVVSLADPVGIALCGEDPRVSDECTRILADGDLVLRMLEEAGLSPVDLRSVWQGQELSWTRDEVVELELRHRLPVHPDAAGHTLLETALWPWVEAAL